MEEAQDEASPGMTGGAIFQDVARLKQIEDERDRLLAQLRHINEQLTVTSLREKERAEEAETARGDTGRLLGEMDATLAAIADALIVYGPRGEILRMNAAAERLLGYTAAERARPLAERMAALRLLTPDGQALPPEQAPNARAVRGEIVEGQVVVLERQGRTFWLSCSAAPILAADGALRGAAITITDVTALHELQQRTEDLIRMVSHDLRNPLGTILGYVHILQRTLDESEATALARRSVECINVSARRMNAMIQDLVDMARGQSGQLELEKRPVDLQTFVADLLERCRLVMDVRRISVEIPAGLAAVAADHNRLERILANLLSNALKYSPPESTVLISVREHTDELEIAVADHGVGIAAEDLPHIFERMYRARDARRTEGLGMGLYITRMLVEAHGGRICAESQPGRGTTIYFTLPRAT